MGLTGHRGVSPTRRRAVGPLIAGLAFLVAPLAPEAQAPGKVWRVGVLTGSVPRLSAPFRALEQRLSELGYVEGRNLAIEFRTASGRAERLPDSPPS